MHLFRLPAPDGLDELRLGRPRYAGPLLRLALAAIAGMVLSAAAFIAYAMSPKEALGGFDFLSWIGLMNAATSAGLLATCQCEADVRAGRVSRWANPWDGIQLLLLLGTGSWCLRSGDVVETWVAAFCFTMALVHSAFAIRRRRRGRARAKVDRAFD